MFYLSFGDIYLSLGISLSFSELFCCEYFEYFFYISLLLYYFNPSPSIVSFLFSGDTYLSLGISLSCLFLTVSEPFETF